MQRIRKKETARVTAGLPTANITSSQPCGTGKTFAAYFVAVDQDILGTSRSPQLPFLPSLVATCRLRLVVQFMTSWIEQERAQAQLDFLQRRQGNPNIRPRRIHYFAVCSRMPISNGIRMLSGEEEIVKTIYTAVKVSVMEHNNGVADKDRTIFRFFTIKVGFSSDDV